MHLGASLGLKKGNNFLAMGGKGLGKPNIPGNHIYIGRMESKESPGRRPSPSVQSVPACEVLEAPQSL